MTETPLDGQHTLLVVGEGEVADALEAFALTLGWRPLLVNTVEDTTNALTIAHSVVVLSHHDGIDGPALAAAVEKGVAYVAAMGSRRTQARRRQWLLDNGVAESDVDAIRGPAGLAIGAHKPAEIAASIVAEIIAVHRGVSGGSLRDRDGPIHPDLPAGTAECPAG